MSEVVNEHLEYLSLPNRSRLYRQAIDAVLRPGDTVADLGCGVGVLGMFCLDAGASEVWGIDKSDAIHLARETAQREGHDGTYHCIAESTFRTDLPQQVDLIICDHVGFFGFDYGIIEMLEDARRRMLKPGGTIMPQSMRLMIAAVSSDTCRDKSAAWTNDIIPDQFRWLDEYHRNARHHHAFAADELLSSPAELGEVVFDAEVPELFSFQATLVAERAGRFDGIAGWFDCHLGGGIRMTNSPLADESIERSQALLPIENSFDVAQGDEITVTIKFRKDLTMIAWNIEPPCDAPTQKLSTWKSTILTPADLVKRSGQPLALNASGKARAFVLAQVDGRRTSEEIIEIVLAERPTMFASESSIRDFVHAVLAQDCTV